MKNIKRVIVTSGGTREWIDPVRYISNASSGKMGFSIALEFLKLDLEVIYIRGNVSDKYAFLEGAKNINIESTLDLLDSIKKEFIESTLLVMAAAPADFRPIQKSNQKIKKKSDEAFQLVLEQNPDILASLKEWIHQKQFKYCELVGFAAETHDLEKNAQEKLKRKGLKYIIANQILEDSGFGENDTSIKIYSKNGEELVIHDMSKEFIAKEIVSFLEKNL